ncbi:rod shape-determining protein MreD [Thiomicrospira sp. WB1]|uniref:rod shape-determining protein MreD n=1 Tax=Thiomicrospira sp. WB1 TaxID=1685380 RepID=UPI00074625F7|nr:rod shape-determining protein MreD [Thiomicrospira sp. WB1]KUJ71552.1 rod shape-determining protein MreD [Thiomicrospira sp. WB1]
MTTKVFSLKLSDVKWLWLASFLIGLVLDTMLMISADIHNAPSLTLLILIFWTTQIFEHTHLFSAFILGLLFDAILASPLGAHALLFVLITFMMLRIRQSFKAFPVWQQSMMIVIYYAIFQALSWLLLQPALSGAGWTFYVLEPVFAGLLWPVITMTLARFTQKLLFH